MKNYLIDEVRKFQKIAGLLREEQTSLPVFTIISSYTSRNEEGSYDYDYVTGTNARSALVNYFVTNENIDTKTAEEYISEIETNFQHVKKGNVEMWITDDPFYVVVSGKVSVGKIENVLKRIYEL